MTKSITALSLRSARALMLAPMLLIGAAACSNDTQPDTAVDAALQNDLALAATTQPYGPQFVSPMEQGMQPQQVATRQAYAGNGYGYSAPAPAPVRRTTAAARRPASSSSGAGQVYNPGPASGTIIKKNTKRDAVIGAAVGAGIGQAIGKDTKGTLIGAAAGGILGAVIGNNVDVNRVP